MIGQKIQCVHIVSKCRIDVHISLNAIHMS